MILLSSLGLKLQALIEVSWILFHTLKLPLSLFRDDLRTKVKARGSWICALLFLPLSPSGYIHNKKDVGRRRVRTSDLFHCIYLALWVWWWWGVKEIMTKPSSASFEHCIKHRPRLILFQDDHFVIKKQKEERKEKGRLMESVSTSLLPPKLQTNFRDTFVFKHIVLPPNIS